MVFLLATQALLATSTWRSGDECAASRARIAVHVEVTLRGSRAANIYTPVNELGLTVPELRLYTQYKASILAQYEASILAL